MDQTGSLRRSYYDVFSNFSDLVIRLHSRDREGAVRNFIAEETNLSPGDNALDLCTGSGSVAVELVSRVGKMGLVVGLDFSQGMLAKAKKRSKKLNLDRLFLVQSYAHLLPFKPASFGGVTCSHVFYELKGKKRNTAVEEAARVLRRGGRFCLMEHAKPRKLLPRIFFYIRILLLGSKDPKRFLGGEQSIFPGDFTGLKKVRSPTGQSILIYGEKKRLGRFEEERKTAPTGFE